MLSMSAAEGDRFLGNGKMKGALCKRGAPLPCRGLFLSLPPPTGPGLTRLSGLSAATQTSSRGVPPAPRCVATLPSGRPCEECPGGLCVVEVMDDEDVVRVADDPVYRFLG